MKGTLFQSSQGSCVNEAMLYCAQGSQQAVAASVTARRSSRHRWLCSSPPQRVLLLPAADRIRKCIHVHDINSDYAYLFI
jgi:hypothetical protein